MLVALQLYYKENLGEVNTKVKTLFDTLLQLAETHKERLLPGYTHLQVAMPSSFGLWFSAYAELLIDDVYMLNAVSKIADQNPLGSAAGYGSSFPINRTFTTKELKKIIDFSKILKKINFIYFILKFVKNYSKINFKNLSIIFISIIVSIFSYLYFSSSSFTS